MQCVSPETEFWKVPAFEVENQHILVTGGSSGFGRHFAHFLASNGANVTLAARRAEALASVVAEINRAGKAQSFVLDVTLVDSIDRAMEQAEAKFGPIHAVVNNAGVTATKPALDQDEARVGQRCRYESQRRLAGRAGGSEAHDREQGAEFDRQHRIDAVPF
jgi:NAD(P)-dependent dehydrogenase (short-subunit alcohol dehydrogenase family)